MGPTLVRRNGQHQDLCLNRIRCCLCRIPMTGLEELWLWFKDFYFLSFRSGGIGFRCVADVAWTSEELHYLIPFLCSVQEMFSIYSALILILFFLNIFLLKVFHMCHLHAEVVWEVPKQRSLNTSHLNDIGMRIWATNTHNVGPTSQMAPKTDSHGDQDSKYSHHRHCTWNER